jgi:hypothetical protein
MYTTCISTGKPRYVKYDFSKEKKQIARLDYFYIGYHYLDFNRKVFSEVSTMLRIEKFYRTK